MRITGYTSKNLSLHQNYLNKKAVGSSLEKLSSGLAINKASDDAASLSISQKLEAQIRGLAQSERNTQDSISLLQTVDGALDSLISVTQRMRELSVKAANETLSDTDRESIQDEIDQLKTELGTIVETTAYNDETLFVPSEEDATQTPTSSQVDVVFVVDNSGSMSSIQQTVADNISSFIEQIISEGVTDIRIGLLYYSDDDFITYSFSGSDWTSDSSDIQAALSSLVLSGGREDAMEAITTAVNYYDYRENQDGTQTRFLILISDEDADDDELLDETLDLVSTEGIRVYGVYNTEANDVDEFDTLIDYTGGKSVNLQDTSWSDELSNVIGSHIGESGSINDNLIYHLQVGPNDGQEYTLSLDRLSLELLGFDDDTPSVATFEDAESSITFFDDILSLLSTERSHIGAIENVLYHYLDNASVMETNLTNAKSLITDTNMAKETMKLTKAKILNQVYSSLFSQNSLQSTLVLNLLKEP